MAKVTLPMLSGTARNQIGQSMVFFPWKGIQAVRAYIKPANPNTDGQQQVRGYVRDVVKQWRSLGYTKSDKTAYNAWALILPKVMSGFNAYVRDALLTLNEGKTYVYPYNGGAVSEASGTIDVSVCVKDDVGTYTAVAYADTKEHGKLHSKSLLWDSIHKAYMGTFHDLVPNAAYWVWVEFSAADYGAATGDYRVVVV